MSWEALVAAGLAIEKVELAPLTTYKLGGPAELFVDVDDRSVLAAVGEALQADPRPVLVLGRGSNLLIADSGFPGVVIRLGAAFTDLVLDEARVEAGGGLSLPRVARAACAAGRGGLEWGVGIPGSVGGAVRQNAGCFGHEVVDVLVAAEVFALDRGTLEWRSAGELDLSYRHSNLRPADVVVTARFTTVAADPAECAETMREITRWRKDNQPGGTLNAGSVFKNPPGDEASGAIVDRLGLKGFSIGPVRVSPRHANFIEAQRDATAADVKELIETVRKKVGEETGVWLEPEIQFVGFDEGS